MAESFRAKKDGQVGFVHTINGEQRFIADVDDPATGVSAGMAALISGGRATVEIPARAAAAFGSESAQQFIDTQAELFASLEEARPISTALGGALPGFAVPGGKVV